LDIGNPPLKEGGLNPRGFLGGGQKIFFPKIGVERGKIFKKGVFLGGKNPQTGENSGGSLGGGLFKKFWGVFERLGGGNFCVPGGDFF